MVTVLLQTRRAGQPSGCVTIFAFALRASEFQRGGLQQSPTLTFFPKWQSSPQRGRSNRKPGSEAPCVHRVCGQGKRLGYKADIEQTLHEAGRKQEGAAHLRVDVGREGGAQAPSGRCARGGTGHEDEDGGQPGSGAPGFCSSARRATSFSNGPIPSPQPGTDLTLVGDTGTRHMFAI